MNERVTHTFETETDKDIIALAYTKYTCQNRIKNKQCKITTCSTCPKHKLFMDAFEQLSPADKLEIDMHVNEAVKMDEDNIRLSNNLIYGISVPKNRTLKLSVICIIFLFIIPAILLLWGTL